MLLAAGTRLGSYEIVAAIGAGGMGEVYRAHDSRLHRDVALKILPAELAADPERRTRFEREAQAIAALSHPNVLAVHDIGSHDDRIFLVTELLDGETLAERLRGGAFPLRKAVDIAVQMARGLAAAHDKHIVHRDLKPANVFLLRDGRVKILDFGLARFVPPASGMTETRAVATEPGVVMGTVGYMAPEQVRGEDVDARADLFAFGAVLYEMLTGRRAFRRDTAAETMTAILRDDPEDLQQVRADLPPALDRIVRHCLEKSPDERFQSARDVAFALDALSESSPARSVPAGSAAPGRRRDWRLALAVAAAAGVVAALVWLGPWSSSDLASPAPVTLGSAFQATADEGLEVDPTLSPDGTLLAYAAGTGRRMRVFIRPVAGGRTLSVSDVSDALEYQPRFSPDGRQILYLTPAGAFVASSLGGAARRIVSGWIDAAAWAPDGRRLLVARGSELSVVPIDDPAAERTLSTEVHEPHACAWAPDDTWIACVSGNRGWTRPGSTFGNVAPSAIVLVPAGGGPAVEIVDGRALNLSPVWGEDGRHLYFVSNRNGPRDIYAMEIGADGRPIGEPARISTGLGVQAIAFSAAARRLAYATYTARANIWSVPIPTREPVDASAGRPLTSENQIIESVSVSADARWLVFDSDRHLNGDLFRMPIGGGPAERLTTDPAGEFAPDLSPDGRELVFHSFRTGTRDIFVTPFEGGQARAITSTPSQESYPAWSPDGRAIVYFDQSMQDGQTRGLFLMRRDESGRWSAPEQLRAGTEYKGSWVPPEGRSVVTVRADAIEVIDVESRKARVAYRPASAGDPPAVSAVASADGRHIYFKSHDAEQRASLWVVPFAGGRPALLVRFGDPARQSIRRDFAVGAGQFFFTIEERQADVWVAEVARR